MQVLFSTGALYGLPFVLTFRLAAAAGFDGVELVLDPVAIAAGPESVKAAGTRAGVAVAALHPPLFALPGWSNQPELFRRLGRWAVALDGPIVVLHPPRADGLAQREAEFNEGLEALREVAPDTAVLTVENTAIFRARDRRYPYVWPARVAQFAQEHGLGMTFDTAHAATTGEPLLDLFTAVSESVWHVHLSDFRMPHMWADRPSLDTYLRHHQMPGQGSLPLEAFVGALVVSGYQRAITLEVSPVALRAWDPVGSLHRLRQAVALVRTAIRAAASREEVGSCPDVLAMETG